MMKKSILMLLILFSINVVTFAQKPEEKVVQAVEFLKDALVSGNIQDKTEFCRNFGKWKI